MFETADALNALTSDVIGAAMAIHRSLGPGLLETAYLSCLAFELTDRRRPYELQKPLPLVYRDVRMDCAYRADVIVAGVVLLEVKALEAVSRVHVRQLQTYVQLSDCRVGLLLNFGAMTMKEGITRVVNRFPEG